MGKIRVIEAFDGELLTKEITDRCTGLMIYVNSDTG